MTATLLLIRHAAHGDLDRRFTGRADGVPLTDAGRAQARALGQRLASERIDAIYCSPRLRTRETAEAVAAHRSVPIEEHDALDEIDLGDWTGARIEDLIGTPEFTAWNERRGDGCPPNGEPYAAVAKRATAFAAGLASRHAGQIVALVSHQDVIKALVAGALGLPLDNVLRFELAPASVSRLAWGDWGAKLVTLNEGAAA
ncbi:histidine phosphatase family protein [Sphingomonas sp. ID1715]|uniref:histidine phosphatase family protein n=1 Tax=Sphingomonas sp. ID1715 TaxID=1656898 RepID=UPI0014886F3F|nr:histidine phosphatase family protein [Sphingomonas sp. ID1715]NNM78751.1 histidine phosphatase family protein [Sphingomonas sp. ID1715]